MPCLPPPFLKHLEVWALHPSPLPAFENWPPPLLGIFTAVCSDSTKLLARWGLVGLRVGAGFFRSKQNLNALAPNGGRKWKYTPEQCTGVTLGLPGWWSSRPHRSCPALITVIRPKLGTANLFTHFPIRKTMHHPQSPRQSLACWGWGALCNIPSHAPERGEAGQRGYLIRSVCWFEQRPYAVKWKQKTKFSWAILLFLLQVLGHFTKAAQTRMSLVLKPQVNLPLFHMIKPDNCVLIANVVGEIQFLGPPKQTQCRSESECCHFGPLSQVLQGRHLCGGLAGNSVTTTISGLLKVTWLGKCIAYHSTLFREGKKKKISLEGRLLPIPCFGPWM